MPAILLAIADPLLRQTVAEHLEAAGGYEVRQAAAADQGEAGAAGAALAVIDEALAHGDDPVCLCRRLRDNGFAAPMLLLGSAVEGCPADAAMAKPLRLGALSAKIADMLAHRPEPECVRVGAWTLDRGRRVLSRPDRRPARLTDKEAAILLRLAQAEGEPVARDVLLADIWGYSAQMDTHTLETHVYRLRRKIDPDGAERLLVNEDGGYRLVGQS